MRALYRVTCQTEGTHMDCQVRPESAVRAPQPSSPPIHPGKTPNLLHQNHASRISTAWGLTTSCSLSDAASPGSLRT